MTAAEVTTQTNQNVQRVELSELSSKPGATGPLLRRQVDLIRDVKVKVFALLGDTEVTIGRLFDLREGEVLKLDRQINQLIELHLDGKPVARGELVVVGDQFGLQVTEIAQK